MNIIPSILFAILCASFATPALASGSHDPLTFVDDVDLIELSDEELPEKKAREVLECGAIYNAKAAPPCTAIDWEMKASKFCPVKLYNLKKDRSCPGFDQKEVTDFGCYAPLTDGCPAGYDTTHHWTTSHKNGACGHYTNRHWLCEKIEECRKPEFGVFEREICNSPKHPPIKWELCRHDSFGIYKHKSCELMMTNQEIHDFVLVANSAISPWSQLLVSGKVNFLAASLVKKDMACMIARYDGIAKYKRLVTQLKSFYKSRFNKAYATPAEGYCEGVDTSPSIPTPAEMGCEDESEDDVCINVNSYHNAKAWFEARIAYIPSLIEDLVSRSKYDTRAKQKADLVKLEQALSKAFREAN